MVTKTATKPKKEKKAKKQKAPKPEAGKPAAAASVPAEPAQADPLVGRAKIESMPLAKAAMLVCIDVHQWGNRSVEPLLAEKTAQDMKADAGMFFTTKKLVGREAIKGVSSAFSRFKAHHYKNTLPWLDNGYRVLPAANYFVYIEEANRLKEEALAEVETFLKVYPLVRAAAEKRLGDAFDEEDYPSPNALRRKWGIDTHITPIPDKADFRTALPKEEIEKIAADIDQQVDRALKNAIGDLFERLFQVTVTLRDKLKAYKVTEDKGKKKVENAFRDSAVTNIRELCELLPRLNFTGDPELTKMANEVCKSLGTQEPEILRDDDESRKKAVDQADAILAKLAAAGYVGEVAAAE
jgi:hypothetical protein